MTLAAAHSHADSTARALAAHEASTAAAGGREKRGSFGRPSFGRRRVIRLGAGPAGLGPSSRLGRW